MHPIMESIGGVGAFLLYFLISLALMLVFCRVYSWVTPHREMDLIREGKLAPAISFGGAILGFVLPLASAISHSVSIADMLIWALLAMFAQIATFAAVWKSYRNLVDQIEHDHLPSAVLLATFAIAIGILNAASMTY